ncbi:hypothetical protein SDC9_102956 [bioreactor metagenome]|uniref:Uncharacterized protein n=1 Tax=bioreactor metagenome TaxID=1076179 RepID=A0A645ASA5_9ZZZZ
MALVGAAVAAHPDHQRGRVHHHAGQPGAVAGRAGAVVDLPGAVAGQPGEIGDDDLRGRVGAVLGDIGRQWGQRPGTGAAEPDRPAVEDRPGHPGQVARPGPAQGVQRGQAQGIRRCGEHRRRVEALGQQPGQRIRRARVSADQRHREPARLVEHDDPRVVRLVRQQRGDDPCRGAQRQVADDQVAGGPRRRQPGGGRTVEAQRLPPQDRVDPVGMATGRRAVGHLPDPGGGDVAAHRRSSFVAGSPAVGTGGPAIREATAAGSAARWACRNPGW